MKKMNNTDPTHKIIKVSTDLETWVNLGRADDEMVEYNAQKNKPRKRKAEMFEWLRSRKN